MQVLLPQYHILKSARCGAFRLEMMVTSKSEPLPVFITVEVAEEIRNAAQAEFEEQKKFSDVLQNVLAEFGRYPALAVKALVDSEHLSFVERSR